MLDAVGTAVRMGLIRMITVAIVLLLHLAAAGSAQVPNFRQDLPEAPYPGLLRPYAFSIARTGVVPVTAGLDKMVFLGEFKDRFGREIGSLPGKLAVDGKLYARAGTGLYGAFNGRTLRLEVRSSEPDPAAMPSDFDFYFPDDRVELHLDLNHDHYTFERVAVMPNGKTRQWSYIVRENHLAPDRRHTERPGAIVFKTKTSVDTDGWTLTVDISMPDSIVGGRPWTVIGLNAVRYRAVNGEETGMWCPDSNRVWAPLYFGDLYLGAPPALVERVVLGRVNWGENDGELLFKRGGFPVRVEVGSWNSFGLHEKREFPSDGSICRFSYGIDPRELLRGALSVSLDGREWGRYIFGWRQGLLLTHHPTGKGLVPRPATGEPDYRWKLARYVLDRLPRLERSPDGLNLSGDGLSLDLASPDPFTPLARYIIDRFEGDDERLVAATLVLCQRGVMVSSGSGERVVQPLGPLGTLRAGAAFCNSYADMLRELICRIEDAGGKPFRACVLCFKDGPVNTGGWPHHWLAGVSYRDGLTLLDSELGTFFVNPENNRLATLRELLAHPEWADSSAHLMSEYFRDRPISDFGVRESGDLWMLD